MKEVRRDPVGGWLSKRQASVWMFKSSSEESSRAQVQSVWRHHHLVANWALTWTNQAVIMDYRWERWRGAGSSIFFGKDFNVILFLPKQWSENTSVTPPFSLFLHSGSEPWLWEDCGQRRLSFPSPLWAWVKLGWDGLERKPFHIPSFPHANLHLPTKKKMPMKSEFPVSFVVLLAAKWDRVLVAEKVPSLSLLVHVPYSSELGKHFIIWFNSCLWNCCCHLVYDYCHHKENSMLSTWSQSICSDRSYIRI